VADSADIFGATYFECALLGDQRALGLRQRGLRLRNICARDFADPKPVLRRLELLAQHLHIVALHLNQSLVANDIEIGHRDGLKHRSFDRQGLRPRGLHRVYRLTRLRDGAAAAVDRLRGLELHEVRPGNRVLHGSSLACCEFRSVGRSLQGCCGNSGLARECDSRAPERQRLRNLLVRCPQQGALRQQLRIGVVSLGQSIGKRLGRRRDSGQRNDSRGNRQRSRDPAPAALCRRLRAAGVKAGRTTPPVLGHFPPAPGQGVSRTQKRALAQSPAVWVSRRRI
jgi:hypothetical protein